ncbi:MAG: hypothetical protein ABL955_11920, partial [Elusimicrobiota bacterium]
GGAFHSTLYEKTSIGLAAALGGGAQFQFAEHLLGGIEGRWTICQIDRDSFGGSTWNRLAAYLWIGAKWNAPL